jgi:hypothetical protein
MGPRTDVRGRSPLAVTSMQVALHLNARKDHIFIDE